ncbi:hypothetical protein GLA29479_4433 [Lysobacter antibioticus]|nr:hypothetical protein GLA29479_4433 [Lysobacter antibioticus]
MSSRYTHAIVHARVAAVFVAAEDIRLVEAGFDRSRSDAADANVRISVA